MKKSLLALALLAAPFAASAQERPNYNYVQGGYTHVNGDNNSDAKGWNLEGSMQIAPNWHLFAGTDQLKIKDVDVGVQQYKLGAGFQTPISANTDFVARGAVNHLTSDDIKIGGVKVAPGASQTGGSVEAGVRSMLSPNFEGYAFAGYEKFGKDGIYEGTNTFYGRLGGAAQFNPNWGVFGDVKFNKHDQIFSIGPRFSW